MVCKKNGQIDPKIFMCFNQFSLSQLVDVNIDIIDYVNVYISSNIYGQECIRESMQLCTYCSTVVMNDITVSVLSTRCWSSAAMGN